MPKKPSPLIHQLFISIGCVTGFISFLTHINNWEPAASIAMLLAPLITIIGVLIWSRYRYATRDDLKEKDMFADEPIFIGGSRNTVNPIHVVTHFGEFATGIALFLMLMALGISVPNRNSEAYTAAKNYVETDKNVVQTIGKVKYFGWAVSGKTSSDSASLRFTVMAAKGSYEANLKLVKSENHWKVDQCSLYGR